MEADNFCLSVLQDVLKLPFHNGSAPTVYYCEPNNKSCVGQELFIFETIQTWEKLGRVKKVQDQPLIVNPLTVAQKLDTENMSTKLRLVIDMSRCINPLVDNEHVKLDSLDYSEPVICPGDYMMVFYLESMYH